MKLFIYYYLIYHTTHHFLIFFFYAFFNHLSSFYLVNCIIIKKQICEIKKIFLALKNMTNILGTLLLLLCNFNDILHTMQNFTYKTYLKYSSRRIFLTLLYENKNIKIKTVHCSIHKGNSTYKKMVYLFEYNDFLNDLIALSIISSWWYNYQQTKKM